MVPMLPVTQVKTKSVVLSNVEFKGTTANVGVNGITEIKYKIILYFNC